MKSQLTPSSSSAVDHTDMLIFAHLNGVIKLKSTPVRLSRAYRRYWSTSKVSLGGKVSNEIRNLGGSSPGSDSKALWSRMEERTKGSLISSLC